MTNLCSCKYPLMISDEREDTEVSYLAFPDEFIDEMEGEIIVPNIMLKELEGLDGITRQYIEVQWKETKIDNVKKYDVNGHIIYAGCDENELQCDRKSVYRVLHPLEEWVNYHIVVIKSETK